MECAISDLLLCVAALLCSIPLVPSQPLSVSPPLPLDLEERSLLSLYKRRAIEGKKDRKTLVGKKRRGAAQREKKNESRPDEGNRQESMYRMSHTFRNHTTFYYDNGLSRYTVEIPFRTMKSSRPPARPPGRSVSVGTLLLQARLISILLTFFSPFRSLIAWQMLCGRSLLSFVHFIQRIVLKVLGWLSARPAGAKTLRKILFPIVDIRRYHVVAGTRVAMTALPIAPFSLFLFSLSLLS